jgi:four helix bundle protein
VQNYRRLKVMAKVRPLVVAVYAATDEFPRHELYGITSQMRRAAFGSGLAIAEGCGRATTPDLIRFLSYANGSAQEVEYAAEQSIDLGFGDAQKLRAIMRGAQEIQKMLCALIAALRRRLDRE